MASGWDVEDTVAFTCSRASSSFGHSAEVEASSPQYFPAGFGSGGCHSRSSQSPVGLVKPSPVIPGWTMAAARVTFILLGAASLFQPPDPQQDTVSLTHSVNQLVQLVWPCRGQVSGLAPPGALMAALDSRSCPEEPCLSPARMPAPCRGQSTCSCWKALRALVCMEVLEMGAG